jgi:hypothetical protein
MLLGSVRDNGDVITTTRSTTSAAATILQNPREGRSPRAGSSIETRVDPRSDLEKPFTRSNLFEAVEGVLVESASPRAPRGFAQMSRPVAPGSDPDQK